MHKWFLPSELSCLVHFCVPGRYSGCATLSYYVSHHDVAVFSNKSVNFLMNPYEFLDESP